MLTNKNTNVWLISVFQLALVCFCKAVLCWKHYKNCAFSRAQLLCITDRKKVKALFEDPSQNTPFQTKSAIWGFPLCPRYGHKKVTRSKTDSVNENAIFRLPKQIVFWYLSPKNIPAEKNFLFPTSQKHCFSGLVLNLSFSSLFTFSLFLSPTQKQKWKMHLFSKTLFWHYFGTPAHSLWFLKYQKHSKTGEMDQFRLLTWTSFDLWKLIMKPQILHQFFTVQHAYIYIYIHI